MHTEKEAIAADAMAIFKISFLSEAQTAGKIGPEKVIEIVNEGKTYEVDMFVKCYWKKISVNLKTVWTDTQK